MQWDWCDWLYWREYRPRNAKRKTTTGQLTTGLRTTRSKGLASTELRVLSTEWGGMRIENRGLKIEKELEERSRRYALCALLFAVCGVLTLSSLRHALSVLSTTKSAEIPAILLGWSTFNVGRSPLLSHYLGGCLSTMQLAFLRFLVQQRGYTCRSPFVGESLNHHGPFVGSTPDGKLVADVYLPGRFRTCTV